jgi:hypothetical protein
MSISISRCEPRAVVLVAALICGIAFATAAAGADTVSGTLKYKDKRTALKYAWLVTGPNDLDNDKTVRRLVLSESDIGPQLQACQTFACTNAEVNEGMTVDFIGGPRVLGEFPLKRRSASGTALGNAPAIGRNQVRHREGEAFRLGPPVCSR